MHFGQDFHMIDRKYTTSASVPMPWNATIVQNAGSPILPPPDLVVSIPIPRPVNTFIPMNGP